MCFELPVVLRKVSWIVRVGGRVRLTPVCPLSLLVSPLTTVDVIVPKKEVIMESDFTKERTAGKEFMLKEYERIHSLVLDEIRQSEQRVNFFITIASAIGGILVIFSQVSTLPAYIKLTVVEGVLVVLLMYGLITLNRLTSRIIQLRTFRKLQNEIRRYFANRDSEVAAYLEFHDEILKDPELFPKKNKMNLTIARWLRGTLQDLMILTNGVICGGIALAALLNTRLSIPEIIGWTVVTVIGAAIFLLKYHYYMRTKLPPMA